MNKKYILKPTGNPLYNTIFAIKDFVTITGKKVKAGDLGGFIEKGSKLSQQGSCWVFKDSTINAKSNISGDCVIDGNSNVSNSNISGLCIIQNSHILGCNISGKCNIQKATIAYSQITDFVNICLAKLIRKSRLKNRVTIRNIDFISNCKIMDGVYIGDTFAEKTNLKLQDSTLQDNATIITNNVIIADSKLSGDAFIGIDNLQYRINTDNSTPLIFTGIEISTKNDIMIIPSIAPNMEFFYCYNNTSSNPKFLCGWDGAYLKDAENTGIFKTLPERMFAYTNKDYKTYNTIPNLIFDFLKNNINNIQNISKELTTSFINKVEEILFIQLELNDATKNNLNLYMMALLVSIARWFCEKISMADNANDINRIFGATPSSWKKFLTAIVENSNIDISTNRLLGFDDIIFYNEELLGYLCIEDTPNLYYCLKSEPKAIEIPFYE